MKLTTIFLLSLLSITNLSSIHQTESDEVSFRIKKGFSNVEGHFKKCTYKIGLKGNDLENISGTVEVSSIKSSNSKRDKHLQNKEWFDAEKHPQIAIQSKKISKKREGEYVGTFEIKIKGKTKLIDIPFQVVKNEKEKVLKIVFTLSIKTFDIGGGFVSFLVGDKVTINLNLPF